MNFSGPGLVVTKLALEREAIPEERQRQLMLVGGAVRFPLGVVLAQLIARREAAPVRSDGSGDGSSAPAATASHVPTPDDDSLKRLHDEVLAARAIAESAEASAEAAREASDQAARAAERAREAAGEASDMWLERGLRGREKDDEDDEPS
jgi:hypothetical protein